MEIIASTFMISLSLFDAAARCVCNKSVTISRDPAQTRRYDTINVIVQSEAEKRPRRVSYLDTYFFFAGPDGGYAQYVSDSAGKLVKMRAEDGVHFERPAGDLIAEKVLERFEERFVLRGPRGG